MPALEIERLRAANADPEFRIAARFWNAALLIREGESGHVVRIRDGEVAEITPWLPALGPSTSWSVSISAPSEEWARFLEPEPRPFYQDLWGASLHHGFRIEGDMEGLYPYYPAVRRLLELVRAAGAGEAAGRG